MANTIKRLSLLSNVPTAMTSCYTVPVGKSAIVKEIVVCNKNATEQTINVCITSGGSNYHIVSGKKVPPNDTLIISLSTVISAGDELRAYASLGTVFDLTISGVEVG